jgi:hypothetical protein
MNTLSQISTLLQYLGIPAKLDAILANQEKTMAAIDDLKAIVTKLAADVAAELAALTAAQASGNDAAIEAAVANLQTLSAQLESSVSTGPTPRPQP